MTIIMNIGILNFLIFEKTKPVYKLLPIKPTRRYTDPITALALFFL